MLGNSDIPLFQRFVAATTIVPRTFGAEAVVTDTVVATTGSIVAAAVDQQRRSWYAHEIMRCFNIDAM